MRSASCAVIVLLSACAHEKEVMPPPAVEEMTIDDYVGAISELRVENPSIDEGPAAAPAREGDYQCTTQNVKETRQYDKLVALSANSESLWPGAILAGDSIYSGLFTQLVFDRSPLPISVSLENLTSGKSTVMQRPSLSNFRDSIGQILSGTVTGATPANISSEIEQVHSERQLALALGASVSYVGVKVNASFNWTQHDVMSRYVVKYTQAYYTVDADQPQSASAFLTPQVTLDDVRARVGQGNPPVYVSSITYGRMVLFTFESRYSAEELGAALDFAYRGGVDVSGSTSVRYRDVISSSKISAYILGGSAETAAQSIDSYEALMAFIKNGGNYSKDSPGAPIAYKLAYLRDNAPARLSFTTDYDVKDCVRVSQKVKVTLKSIQVEKAGGDPGNDLELFGSVAAFGRAPGAADGGDRMLLSRDATHSMRVAEGETFPQQGTLGEVIVDVVPRGGSSVALRINLLDEDGGLTTEDSIGDELVEVRFETGWRRDVQVYLTGSNARVAVTLHIDPI